MSLPELGRQTLRIGSSESSDLVLADDSVAKEHAEIIHLGQGKLVFLALEEGCFAGTHPIEKGDAVLYDFQNEFKIGREVLPRTHPAIVAMLLSRGSLASDPRFLVVGRDPERAHLVFPSPGVSGKHATIDFGTRSIIDHGSKSGTWIAGTRLEAGVSFSFAESALFAVGPLPLPLELAERFFEATLEKRVPIPREVTLSLSEAPIPDFVSEPPRAERTKHRTLVGTIRMMATGQKTIGRGKDCDIVLDNPQISSRHARLLTLGGQVVLEDSGSELGTIVRGQRLKAHQNVPVTNGEKVLFGPVPAILQIDDGAVSVLLEDEANWIGKPLFEVAAKDLRVEVVDRERAGTKVLLEDVGFRVRPGEMVALMGPSGSGKTTLLHLLTGYRKPTAGTILINGAPIETMVESLRGSIGYVPQDDILHPELTVFEAVRYSARLRLPADYSDEELDERVLRTLSELGLEAVRNLTIGRPEAKVLSGGQRKRVNIALEIVTDPPLLFLDEPTSGLASDDTASLVELLSRIARTQGKTIIATIHQPARDEYERFSHALVLGHGGIPLYFGPVRGAYRFFGAWRPHLERTPIDNPRDMFGEVSERQARYEKENPGISRAEVRAEIARRFRSEFEGSAEGRLLRADLEEKEIELPAPLGKRAGTPRGQLRLLIGRYALVKARDRIGTLILLLQAPIIGVLLALVFGRQKASVPYFCLSAIEELSRKTSEPALVQKLLGTLAATRDQSAAIFFLVVSAIWFGTSNAAREIVSERAIYRRENKVGLSLVSYVFSKFIVLSLLCLGQCAVLYSIVFSALGLAGGFSGFLSGLSLLFLTSVSAVGLGLVLSALVASTEAAMALTPIALIPQVVLGGLMVPVTTVPWLDLPMRLMPARWGFEGVIRVQRLAEVESPAFRIVVPGIAESLPEYIRNGAFECALAQLKSYRFLGSWGFSSAATPWTSVAVLSTMTLVCLVSTMLLIARRARE